MHSLREPAVARMRVETGRAVPRMGNGHVRLGGGDKGDRTPDLVNAIHALSQLSYIPVPRMGFLPTTSEPVKSRLSLAARRRDACTRRDRRLRTRCHLSS